jgi:hypothetical protein
MDVAITQDGRLLLVWNGKPKGTIYFSWATSDRAFLPSEWTDPVAITATNVDRATYEYENSPQILDTQSGKISVAYSISINDGRGIYLVESEDKGATWTKPLRIVDGADYNWEVIGPSNLTLGPDNTKHILFGHQESPFIPNVSNIVYTRLLPNGTISEVSDDLHDAREEDELVVWYKVLSDKFSGISLLWQTQSAFGPTYVWHQYSKDGGLTFNNLPSLQRFSETSGAVDANLDPAGIIHLMLVDQTTDNELLIRNQVFEDELWKIVEETRLYSPQKIHLKSMSAVHSPNGFMGGILIGENIQEDSENQDLVLFIRRFPTILVEATEESDLELATSTSVPTEIPTPTIVLTPQPSETPTPAPRVESLVNSAPPPPSDLVDPMVSSIVAGVVISIAIILLIVVFSFGWTKFRRTSHK